MRLTNEIRDMIVRDILSDIPEVDYAAQMRTRAVEIGREAMPPAVRKVWDNSETRHYVRTSSFYICCMSLMAPGLDRHDGSEILKADEKLTDLHRLHDEQRDGRASLKRDLKTNVYLCTTRKQFVERFPDLAKYAPDEQATTANLPATTSLVDGLKAAGLKLEAA